MCAEDRLYMEGFDRLMISWVHILTASPSISEELQENVCQQVFNTYVKLHIGPPDGSRGSGLELEAEELEENEESDRSRFNGQLEAVGLMARIVPHHSLSLLAHLLEQRTRSLTTLLQKFHQQEITIADNSAILVLFEDIHWLVLISGKKKKKLAIPNLISSQRFFGIGGRRRGLSNRAHDTNEVFNKTRS